MVRSHLSLALKEILDRIVLTGKVFTGLNISYKAFYHNVFNRVSDFIRRRVVKHCSVCAYKVSIAGA